MSEQQVDPDFLILDLKRIYLKLKERSISDGTEQPSSFEIENWGTGKIKKRSNKIQHKCFKLN